MKLKKTIDMMCSADYKDRFIAEYLQLKYRYKKLRMFNTRIKAASYAGKDELMPKHDCSDTMLFDQERAMEEYMQILEWRAVIEGIDLEEALEEFNEADQ